MAAIRAPAPPARNGQLSLKLGKFGAFVGCSNYPDCRYTRPISTPGQATQQAVPAEGIELGADPETGEKVTRREGRFGPYLQLGEAVDGEKPKRSSIPKGYDPSQIDLETALRFLSLPREIGIHPETGKPITTNFGRFGPFVQHDGTYATLEFRRRSVHGRHQPRRRPPRTEERTGARARPGALKDLGAHPDGGGNVQIMSGRYGPYVKYGTINATLPRDKTPETLTLDEAIALLAARAAKGATRKPARAKAVKADETRGQGASGQSSRRSARPSAHASPRLRPPRGRIGGQARQGRNRRGCRPRRRFWNSSRRAAARPVSARSRRAFDDQGRRPDCASRHCSKTLRTAASSPAAIAGLIDTSTLAPDRRRRGDRYRC